MIIYVIKEVLIFFRKKGKRSFTGKNSKIKKMEKKVTKLTLKRERKKKEKTLNCRKN